MGVPKVVFCCGMSRSGGTFQYQIVREILERYGLGRGVGFGHELTTRPLGQGSYVAVKKEQSPSWALQMVRQGKALAVGIYRDPRDVYCSLMEFRRRQKQMTRKDHNALADLVDALAWWKDWEPLAAYVARYEDADWKQEARNIGTLLGVEVDDADDIVAKWSLDRNLKRIQDMQKWLEPADHLLTQAHIGEKRGESRWREELAEAQAKMVACIAGHDWMEEHGYGLS